MTIIRKILFGYEPNPLYTLPVAYFYTEFAIDPMYYGDRLKWKRLVKKAAEDVVPLFDADRLAREYYELMYTV
jgi:hypothetical protein